MTIDLTPIRHLYPFESHWLDLDGVRMHYVDEGTGDTVLMLHGNPSWSFYFRDLVLALRETHRVIVPDHIGCGLSDKPGDDRYDYRLERRRADIAALLDHLKLDTPLTYILHDWGGAIGMSHAVRDPDQVARLVLLNTAAFHLPPGKKLPWQLKLIHGNPRLAAMLVRGCNAFARGAVHTAVTRRMPKDVRRGYLLPYDNWCNRIATLRFVQDIPLKPAHPSYDLIEQTTERLPALAEKPILIGWGLRDFVFNEDFLNVWRQVYPRARYCTYADAGHYVLEDVGDDLIPHIRDFLIGPTPAPRTATQSLPQLESA